MMKILLLICTLLYPADSLKFHVDQDTAVVEKYGPRRSLRGYSRVENHVSSPKVNGPGQGDTVDGTQDGSDTYGPFMRLALIENNISRSSMGVPGSPAVSSSSWRQRMVSVNTKGPSQDPSAIPSVAPTRIFSSSPSASFSAPPTTSLSTNPTVMPTPSPSIFPSSPPPSTTSPTELPSTAPLDLPTLVPSWTQLTTPHPTELPSMMPSDVPSLVPSWAQSKTAHQTEPPSMMPSGLPSALPSSTHSTAKPNGMPSMMPSDLPSLVPSMEPSMHPTRSHSVAPTHSPSSLPSDVPSMVPTTFPTMIPTVLPSAQPSNFPSSNPSSMPSRGPTLEPTVTPSFLPSDFPSTIPTSLLETLASNVEEEMDNIRRYRKQSCSQTADPKIGPNMQRVVIEYKYSLRVLAGNEPIITMGLIEDYLTELLRYFFCVDAINQGQRANNENSVVFSASPADMLSGNVNNVDAAVDGGFTLWIDNTEIIAEDSTQGSSATELVCGLVEQVQSLVDSGTLSNRPGVQTVELKSITSCHAALSVGESLWQLSYVIAASGAFVVLAVGLFWRHLHIVESNKAIQRGILKTEEAFFDVTVTETADMTMYTTEGGYSCRTRSDSTRGGWQGANFRRDGSSCESLSSAGSIHTELAVAEDNEHCQHFDLRETVVIDSKLFTLTMKTIPEAGTIECSSRGQDEDEEEGYETIALD